MSCRCNTDGDEDGLMVDSKGCFRCYDIPKVKGRFGLAWVSESPECPNPEPVGWQVEFCDTPSKVEEKCQEMVRWINCPPLPRCEPCPPDELCSPHNPPRCNPCAPKTNPCIPKCKRGDSSTRKCRCCGGSQHKTRNRCYQAGGSGCCRQRSPGPRRCTCRAQSPKHCTCQDLPVKDTNNLVGSSSGDYANSPTYQQYYMSTYSPKQNQNNTYNTDTEYSYNENYLTGRGAQKGKNGKNASKKRKHQEPKFRECLQKNDAGCQCVVCLEQEVYTISLMQEDKNGMQQESADSCTCNCMPADPSAGTRSPRQLSAEKSIGQGSPSEKSQARRQKTNLESGGKRTESRNQQQDSASNQQELTKQQTSSGFQQSVKTGGSSNQQQQSSKNQSHSSSQLYGSSQSHQRYEDKTYTPSIKGGEKSGNVHSSDDFAKTIHGQTFSDVPSYGQPHGLSPKPSKGGNQGQGRSQSNVPTAISSKSNYTQGRPQGEGYGNEPLDQDVGPAPSSGQQSGMSKRQAYGQESSARKSPAAGNSYGNDTNQGYATDGPSRADGYGTPRTVGEGSSRLDGQGPSRNYNQGPSQPDRQLASRSDGHQGPSRFDSQGPCGPDDKTPFRTDTTQSPYRNDNAGSSRTDGQQSHRNDDPSRSDGQDGFYNPDDDALETKGKQQKGVYAQKGSPQNDSNWMEPTKGDNAERPNADDHGDGNADDDLITQQNLQQNYANKPPEQNSLDSIDLALKHMHERHDAAKQKQLPKLNQEKGKEQLDKDKDANEPEKDKGKKEVTIHEVEYKSRKPPPKQESWLFPLLCQCCFKCKSCKKNKKKEKEKAEEKENEKEKQPLSPAIQTPRTQNTNYMVTIAEDKELEDIETKAVAIAEEIPNEEAALIVDKQESMH